MIRPLPLLLLAAATPALAQMPGSPATPAAAGTYTVDSRHTQAIFAVNHFGFSEFYGIIPNATGTLMLDPANAAADKVDVVLPVAAISTTNSVLDGELKSADWLDAGKFPEIHFVSTKVTQTGAHTARIEGMLTMHGVTKPITLDATLTGVGTNPMSKAANIGFSATGTLHRTEFGVTKYAPNFVGDEVKLTITAAFAKQG